MGAITTMDPELVLSRGYREYPDDVCNLPLTNKTFSGEAFPRKIKAANRPKGRKGFLYECMGQFAEASIVMRPWGRTSLRLE